MADVEATVPPVEPSKEAVVIEESTTKTEVNGDHNNSENSNEVDKVTKNSEECLNGTANVTENGGTAHVESDEKPASPETKETAEAEGEGDTLTTEKKEEETPKVIVHQFPPGKDIPSLSLFCLKLETFLRLNKIPYENQYGYKLGKKGKLPWIEYQGERKTDSSFIIEYLKEKFELQIDQGLSDEDKALGRAVKVMIEENSYWGLSYNRFVDNYNEYKKILAPTSGGIGFNVGLKMTQRKVRAALDGHGIGKHSREEIYELMEKDIMTVSTLLGEKQYLLGDQISSFDCTVFSFFANVLWCGLESPMSTFVKENAANLVAYCERIKEECWTDWAEMVLGDKPEPQLKKGFSFRKKRSKPTKQKEKEEKNETDKKDETEEKTEELEEKQNTEIEEEKEANDEKTPPAEDKTSDETSEKSSEPEASKSQNNDEPNE